MIYPDMREFVEKLLEEGEAVSIEGVFNPELEASRLIAEHGEKCIVFNVVGSRIPVVSNVFASRERILKMLGGSSDEDLYNKIKSALNNPAPLKTARNSPERKRLESVLELPLLKYFPEDGGKYFTSSIVIARDPEENVLNASIHRIMVIDGQHGVIRIVPRHLYTIVEKYRRMGKKVPVIILVSPPPLAILAAALSPPYGVFELEVANSMANMSMEFEYFTRDELPAPSNTHIIIIAKIDPTKLLPEGPFVDVLGIYDKVRMQPVVEFEEILIAENPLYHAILPSGLEHAILMGLPREVAIWDTVRKIIPKVVAVRLTRGSGGWLHAIISIEKTREGDGKNVILATFAAHPSLKHVVVVDSDIDVDSYEEVEWAIATRFRADRDLIIIPRAHGSTLDPVSEDGLTCKMGLDATAPLNVDRNKFTKARL